MEAFSITEEIVKEFYPLLPREFQKKETEEDVILLGAAEMDADGENRVCAAMVISVANDSTLLINWIMVAPEYRNRGAGAAMMELLQDLAKQMNMNILCVFSQEFGMESSDLYCFLEKYGFRIGRSESKSYSVKVGDLEKSEILNRERTKGKNIVVLKDATSRMITEFNRNLAEHGRLLSGPISKEKNIDNISIVHIENEVITSCIIFSEIGEKIIELSFAYSDKKTPMHMYSLFTYAKQLLCQNYDSDTELIIPCVTEISQKLVETLITTATVGFVSYIAQWEADK